MPATTASAHRAAPAGPLDDRFERGTDLLRSSALNRDCHRLLAQAGRLRDAATRFLDQHAEPEAHALLTTAGLAPCRNRDGWSPADGFEEAVRAVAALEWQLDMVRNVIRGVVLSLPAGEAK